MNILSLPIDSGLLEDTRIKNIFEQQGISTYAQLCVMTPSDLYRIPKFGRKSINKVIKHLAEKGLTLKQWR